MTDSQFAALFFLQLASILFVCRLVGSLARRVGQPQVIAETVAGFLIGPSFFGWIAPDAHAALAPPEMRRVRFAASQLHRAGDAGPRGRRHGRSDRLDPAGGRRAQLRRIRGAGHLGRRRRAGYAILVFSVLRHLFVRLATIADRRDDVPAWVLSTVLALLVLGAWFTDTSGIYSVFGAFILGTAIPRGTLGTGLQRLLKPVTTSLLLPLFFVYSGLNTQLGLVDTTWLWGMSAAVLVSACVAKGLACWVAARLTGGTSRDAHGAATLMNARGLMELILLNIGLQCGLITPTLFTILVLMAIGTTVMAYPVFGRIYRVPEEIDDPAVKTA